MAVSVTVSYIGDGRSFVSKIKFLGPFISVGLKSYRIEPNVKMSIQTCHDIPTDSPY